MIDIVGLLGGFLIVGNFHWISRDHAIVLGSGLEFR